MPATTQRYPLSTPEGVAIPLDVFKPHSFLRKSYLAGAASAAVSVPASVEIMSVTSDTDILVKFGGTAVIPADNVLAENTVLIEKNSRVCVAPTAATFTIIGISEAGTCSIQFIDKWAGLAVQTQYTRI